MTLKNKSEMLPMTNQAMPAWEGKARLRQDWCSSKENPLLLHSMASGDFLMQAKCQIRGDFV